MGTHLSTNMATKFTSLALYRRLLRKTSQVQRFKQGPNFRSHLHRNEMCSKTNTGIFFFIGSTKHRKYHTNIYLIWCFIHGRKTNGGSFSAPFIGKSQETSCTNQDVDLVVHKKMVPTETGAFETSERQTIICPAQSLRKMTLLPLLFFTLYLQH